MVVVVVVVWVKKERCNRCFIGVGVVVVGVVVVVVL